MSDYDLRKRSTTKLPPVEQMRRERDEMERYLGELCPVEDIERFESVLEYIVELEAEIRRRSG